MRQGQMKFEQLEIARLKREVHKLKAEWTSPRPTSRKNRREVRLDCKPPGDQNLSNQGGSQS
jgi:hypothetical protein